MLTTLDDRRIELIDRFLDAAIKHPTFAEKWFPLKDRNMYGTRHEEKFKEYRCKTEKGRANPLGFFRRRLNKRAAITNNGGN